MRAPDKLPTGAALDDAVARIFGRTVLGIKPSLDVMEALLEELGNPHRELAVIHVAGTNGKGSVCRMIESTLVRSGIPCALYTSPHLICLNERYRVNGQEIGDADLAYLITIVEEAADSVEKSGRRKATFFEVCTALAFLYFKEAGVKIAIIETGMGGRWDATNLVVPLVSIITRVDLDHQAFLGDTIEKVAAEKGGIIKSGRPVIIGAMPAEAREVLEKMASTIGTVCVRAPQAVSVQCMQSNPSVQKLKIETHNDSYPPIQMKLLGTFQQENAATAVAALEYLSSLIGCELDLVGGLENARWPSRFELIRETPPVILDGAHNPSAAVSLVQSLREIYPDHEVGFVLGFMSDKDVGGILKPIAQLARQAWMAPLAGERALNESGLKLQADLAGLTATQGSPEKMLSQAMAWASESEKRVICICGSLFWRNELNELDFI